MHRFCIVTVAGLNHGWCYVFFFKAFVCMEVFTDDRIIWVAFLFERETTFFLGDSCSRAGHFLPSINTRGRIKSKLLHKRSTAKRLQNKTKIHK